MLMRDSLIIATWILGSVAARAAGPLSLDAVPCLQLKGWLPEKLGVSERRSFMDGLANSLTNSYFNGQSINESVNCIQRVDDTHDLWSAVEARFIDRSVTWMHKAEERGLDRRGALSAFVSLYDTVYPPGSAPLFRVMDPTTFLSSKLPQQFLGGFDREQQSIFLRYASVSADEWNFVLMHELLHALDPTLAQDDLLAGSAIALERVKAIASQAKSTNPRDLKPEDRAFLESWVNAKLGLGLVGEYRAWLLTFALYQDALRKEATPHISFMDQVLSEICSDPSLVKLPMDRRLYMYMDGRFSDPRWPPFDSELLQNVLAQSRQQLRTGQRPILISDRFKAILLTRPPGILSCSNAASTEPDAFKH